MFFVAFILSTNPNIYINDAGRADRRALPYRYIPVLSHAISSKHCSNYPTTSFDVF